MSSTTTTQFYGLTQYTGTDKPDFADNNQAFRNVDADLHQVVQNSQGFTSDIADLTERVGNLDTDLTNLSGDLNGEKAKITALQNKELSQDTEISRVERNAQDMITAYNEASATSTHAYAVGDYFIYNNVLYQATAAIAVGATIVPDTNCTTTNVTSELIQLNNDLADLSSVVYSGGVALISADITSAQDITPSQPFTNFNTIKVRIGAYYSAQNRNLYMQAFDIDLRHLVGSADEFIYSWYQSPTNFMSVEFGIVNGKLQINAIQLGTDTAQNFAVYVEAYGYKQTL